MNNLTPLNKHNVTLKLLAYCQKKFRFSLNARRITLPVSWQSIDIDGLSLYQYPEDENDLLYFTNNDKSMLKELGWLKPLITCLVVFTDFK